MLKLVWDGLKKSASWISGIAVLGIIWKLVDSYLQTRAIKNSDKNARSDEKDHRHNIEDVESDWEKSGLKSDHKS